MQTYKWTTGRGGEVEITIAGTTKKDREIKSFTANGNPHNAKLDWMNGKHAVAFKVGSKTGYAIVPDEIVAEIFAAEIKAEAELKAHCESRNETKKAMSY